MKISLIKFLFVILSALIVQGGFSNLNASSLSMSSSPVPYQSGDPFEIKGVVTDTNGEPLPGVTVKIKGKAAGIHTDMNGEFFLIIPLGSTLEFTYLGMSPKSVVIKNKAFVSVVLENDRKELDEVIITGFNQTTARRTTGSVATVDVSRLTKDSPLKNVDQLLQGRVAGVSVSAVSGRPGESAKIRIRGISTITGNADPLWVIDGIPLTKGTDTPNIEKGQIKSGDFSSLYRDGIAGINPRDIENVTILKDASATAIYGSQGSNGVIVVTTKRGTAGRMRVNYSTNLVLQTKPQRDANLMNSKEKLAFEQELWDEFSAEKFKNGQTYPVVGIVGAIRSGYGKYKNMSLGEQNELIAQLGEQTTDWFDVLFRNSMSQSHNLSLSGGSDKNTYYVSVGYTGNTGIVKKTDSESYNASLKLNSKFNDKLTVEFDTDFSHLQAGGSANSVDPFKYAYFANPYEHPYNEDGSYSANDSYMNLSLINNSWNGTLPANGYNILRDIDETSSETKSTTVGVRSQITYQFNQNFRINGLARYSYTTDNSDNIVGRNTFVAWGDRPFDESNSTRTYGSITQASMNRSSLVARIQLSYNQHLTKGHRISAIGGAEVGRNYSKSIQLKRYGYDPLTGNSSIPLYVDPGTGKIDYSKLISYGALVDGTMGQSIIEDRLASFYLAADYNIKEKYILSTSFRTDGSSNFGAKQQFNPTGSVGLAWNADQESFIDNLAPILSSLTLRLSSGYTGNINRSVYPQLMMDYETTFRKTYNDYFRMGYINNAPNKNLRWEKTFDYKVALDAGFINDRIRLLVEAYVRQTKDAVTSLKIVSTTGFTSQKFNNSELENKGLEFTLSSTILKLKDFTWNASANIGYNINKLTKYTPISGTISSEGNYVDYPLNGLFGGRTIGIDPTTGIYKFELRPDAEAVTDSELRDNTNYTFFLGTSNAPISGGFSMNFSYKDLSLNVGGAYSLNGKVYNNISAPGGYSQARPNTSSPQGNFTSNISAYDLYTYHFNTRKDATNRWTVNNPITDGNPRIIDAWDTNTPIFDYDNPTSSSIMRGALLEDVSYVKITSLSLAYSIPKKIYRRWNLDSVSLVFSTNNLFTFTNYSGIDPETPGAVYPQSRSFSFGLSVSL